MNDAQPVFMANGRPGIRGVCAVCGTGLFKIGATPAHEGMTPPEPAPKTAASGGKKAAKSAKSAKTAKKTTKAAKTATAKPARGAKGSGRLVIVESPAKARTVGRFLGSGYDVRASVGHVRDLLRSRLSVDVENDFEPTYRVLNDKRDVVKGLKSAVAQANEVYLATDPDREGEAIAWHLVEAADIPEEKTRRVVFHEITQGAIHEAFAHSRDIDMDLVDAQQARRILDRLVGYQISPLLWDRVQSRLSAGRVQSVALRLIVEREREILAFVPIEYWSIDAALAQQTSRGQTPRPSFLARLVRVSGEPADLKNREDTDGILRELEGAEYGVTNVKRGERKRRPYPPFTTSTLQQDASQRLGMPAARTMRIAQDLYEGIDIGHGEPVGLITYMRTDSVNVSSEAQAEARAMIVETYGPEYAPATPNFYRTRAKNAQEAHEAIRPTSVRRLPKALKDKLSRDQLRVYELIWQRFVASQMTAAIYDTMTIEVEAGAAGAPTKPYLFRASGSRIRFPGFLVVYSGGASGPAENAAAGDNGNNVGQAEPAKAAASDGGGANEREELAEQEVLPDVSVGEIVDLLQLLPEQHFTQPPPRFTEASLVKALEEYGIGRPSTYAAIISTITDRDYVNRVERKLAPTELGFTVNDLLVKYFDNIFNVGFTATMEEHLDSIANGKEEMVPVLRAFYDFFEPQLRTADATMEKVMLEPEKTGEACPECGGDLIIKNGRFGKFVGCANYPTCKFTKPLLIKVGVACPKDQGDLIERRTRKGRTFYGCANYPECDFVSWQRPIPMPCPHCGGLLTMASKSSAECVDCHKRTPLATEKDAAGEVKGP